MGKAVPEVVEESNYSYHDCSFRENAAGLLQASHGGGASGARGDVIEDELAIGGMGLGLTSMGLASYASIDKGNLGLVFDGSGSNKVLDTMVAKGMNETPAFSIHLDSLDAEVGGTILFGAIDTAKFHVALKSIPMLPRSYFAAALTSFTISTSSGLQTIPFGPVGAVLDTGSCNTILPYNLVDAIYAAIGTTFDTAKGLAPISCDAKYMNGTFDSGLGGADGSVIKVPFREMILQNERECSVGVNPLSSAPSLPINMGDTFLRSAYVVHDRPKRKLGLAQAKFGAKESSIVAFESFGAQFPAADGSSTGSETFSAPKPVQKPKLVMEDGSGNVTVNPPKTIEKPEPIVVFPRPRRKPKDKPEVLGEDPDGKVYFTGKLKTSGATSLKGAAGTRKPDQLFKIDADGKTYVKAKKKSEIVAGPIKSFPLPTALAVLVVIMGGFFLL